MQAAWEQFCKKNPVLNLCSTKHCPLDIPNGPSFIRPTGERFGYECQHRDFAEPVKVMQYVKEHNSTLEEMFHANAKVGYYTNLVADCKQWVEHHGPRKVDFLTKDVADFKQALTAEKEQFHRDQLAARLKKKEENLATVLEDLQHSAAKLALGEQMLVEVSAEREALEGCLVALWAHSPEY